MANLGTGARRELRSWLLAALGAIPLAALLALGIYVLPAALHRPVLVFASVSFWIAIWLADRVPLFAIATWLVPALAGIGLAHRAGSPAVFYGTLVVIAVGIGLMSIYDSARRPWARYCSRIQRWVISHTLPPRDRRVHDALVRGLRLDREMQRVARNLEDLPGTARAFRESADRILAIEAPDEAWASALQAAAEPPLAYADMLEARRPLDFEAIRELTRRRDDTLARLLDSRSRAFAWLTYRAFQAGDRSPS